MKPIIYIAGPYKGKTRFDIVSNLMQAQCAVFQIYRLGAIGIYTPLMTDGFAGEFPEETMLERDFWVQEMCCATYLLRAWQTSAGAVAEAKNAERIKQPTFDNFTDLSVWLKAKSKSQMRRPACQCGMKSEE